MPYSGFTSISLRFISVLSGSSRGLVSRKSPYATSLISHFSEMSHVFRGMWKNYDTEFQGILQSLRRHKDLVERRASVTQYRRYQEDMIGMKVTLDRQIEAEKLKKLVLIREWLAVGQQPADDHALYQNIRQNYSTTAKWILEREAIKQWTEDNLPAAPRMYRFIAPEHTIFTNESLQYYGCMASQEPVRSSS
jgi:hypothetical protein